MSRPSWKGMLSFGLVNVPARLHLATEEKAIRFNQLHRGCNARIRQKRACEGCGEIVEMTDIVKGYPLSKTEYVVMEDADFDALPSAASKVIAVERFIDPSAVDPAFIEGTYYMSPDETGGKGYALVHKAMLATKKAALARIAFREQREHLALVRAIPEGLVLHTMRWPDEIREAAFEPLEKVKPEELKMAKLLVTNMAGSFDPAELHDSYREQLLERIEAKATGEPLPEATTIPERKHAADLMEQLKASIGTTPGPSTDKRSPGYKKSRRAS